MLQPVPLFGIGNQAKSVNVSAQDRLNLYVEINQDAEKHVLTLYPTPGLSSFVDFGSFASRGARKVGNFIYVVNRNKLWKVANNGAMTDVGTLLTTDGRVDMSDNGLQLMVVDGANGYILTLATDVFATIADVDFPGADTVTFLNQRFVVTEPSTGRFYCSALIDGTDWDALEFATAESAPDNLVRVLAEGGNLYLFGEDTTELWGDSGAADFPYARLAGGAVEWGLAARWSLCKWLNSLIFLGKNRLGQVQVFVMSGGQAQPVSNPQIEAQFSSYSSTADAQALTYMKDGHAFYEISFPAEGKTWLYDSQSQSWSRLESYGGRHRPAFSVELLGNVYVADYENGKLYLLDPEVYTDDGQAIAREFTSRHQAAGDFLHCPELWLEMEGGQGVQFGIGQDPQIMLTISRDGGKTWGNELTRSFGRVGQYLARARWLRLGRARDWTFRFRITDPVKTVFVHAWGRFTR